MVNRDVALVYHSHLLSPFIFAKFISSPPYDSLSPKIEFPLIRYFSRLRNLNHDDWNSRTQWERMYPSVPYDVLRVSENGNNAFHAAINRNLLSPPESQSELKFGLNLADAVLRQWGFAKKLLNVYQHDPIDFGVLVHAQRRYGAFMHLIRTQEQMLVPTLDIDLFWHTHQLSPVDYNTWCERHIGRRINHDDTIEEGNLSNGLAATKEAWFMAYGEDYLDSAAPRNAIDLSVSRTPPPNLTKAQQILWAFDVQKQRQHEGFEFQRLQIQERKTLWESRLPDLLAEQREQTNVALAREAELLAARAAARGIPGLHPDVPPNFKSLGILSKLKWATKVKSQKDAFVAEHTKDINQRVAMLKQNIDNERQAASKLMAANSKERSLWQKQRWPLVIAANGGRKPGQSGGLWKTAQPLRVGDVLFPIYAATWYGRQSLGHYQYYDYRYVGFPGGSAIGGYNCGVAFNRGDCTHNTRYTESAGNPSCGGG